MSTTAAHARAGDHCPTAGQAICLELWVTDPEVIAELARFPGEEERDRYAHAALRIGVLSLRHAGGEVDAGRIQREVDRLLGSLADALSSHADEVTGSVARALSGYLDPATGQLPQRLERLAGRDGELSRLLEQHVGTDGSVLATTLAKHLGDSSPILRLLSPERKDGLLETISRSVATALEAQRARILGEFTLDRPDSALARLLAEITDTNGTLQQSLRADMGEMRDQFSLDNPNSALSRLVQRVEAVSTAVAEQFSRDNEDSALSSMSAMLAETKDEIGRRLTLDDSSSPLAILHRELSEIVKSVERSQQDFQAEIRETVARLKATREEAARSTRHGISFEESVGDFVAADAARRNDVYESVGAKVGRIRSSKKGDHVLTLGTESQMAGARIVIEAKADRSYTLAAALAELAEARSNRDAGVGIFVFSPSAKPEGFDTIERHGFDLVVVWDPDDGSTDPVLRLALSVARILAIRQATPAGPEVDFAAADRAIEQIRRDLRDLDEISKWAETVKSSGEKIHGKSGLIKTRVLTQLDALEKQYLALKGLHAAEPR